MEDRGNAAAAGEFTASSHFISGEAPPRKSDFIKVNKELGDANTVREQAMANAFAALEHHLADFAAMLIEVLGDRARAVRWMSATHRSLSGRNGYMVIIDGETDLLWDEVSRTR